MAIFKCCNKRCLQQQASSSVVTRHGIAIFKWLSSSDTRLGYLQVSPERCLQQHFKCLQRDACNKRCLTPNLCLISKSLRCLMPHASCLLSHCVTCDGIACHMSHTETIAFKDEMADAMGDFQMRWRMTNVWAGILPASNRHVYETGLMQVTIHINVGDNLNRYMRHNLNRCPHLCRVCHDTHCHL